MKRVSTYNAVIFLAPLVALGVGGLLYLGQKTRLAHLKQDYENTQKEVAQVQAQLKQADRDFVLKRHPSEVQSKVEQGKFLDMLRQYASETGTEITRWANIGSANTAGGGSPPAPNSGANGASGSKLPPDTLPVSSTIDIRGEYPKVRNFLYKLQLSPRLLTIQQARWTRGTKYPSTMASFSLVRYVRTPTEVEKRAEAQAKPITPPIDTKIEKTPLPTVHNHQNEEVKP